MDVILGNYGCFMAGCKRSYSCFGWLILAFSVLSLSDTIAQQVTVPPSEPTGIKFFTGSWAEVLTEAKRLNKPLFLDIYTTWCPPCRRMAREAFPNPMVGAKFNDYFINYQVNAEVNEGLELGKRYAVASYPTSLFIIPSGELVHRAVGYGGIKALLEQADMVFRLPQVRRSRRKRMPVDEQINPVQPTITDTTRR